MSEQQCCAVPTSVHGSVQLSLLSRHGGRPGSAAGPGKREGGRNSEAGGRGQGVEERVLEQALILLNYWCVCSQHSC